jgi:VanZ family protein
VRPQPIWLAWLPTAAWVAAVLLFSSDLFAAQETGRIVRWVVNALFGPVSRETMESIHLAVRKSAHLFNYAALSVLAYRASRASNPHISPLRWHMAGIGICLLVASLDEWMQSYSRVRTGTPWDVLIDMSGAFAAQIVLALYFTRRRVRA